jgi:hypothetical protein
VHGGIVVLGVVHRRNLIVMPRPMLAAPRRYLIVVLKPLPAEPLAVHRRNLAVEHRLIPAAPLVVRRRYLAVVPRPFSTTPQILGRGVQAAARGAATMPQQGKIKSADLSAEPSKFCRLHLYCGKVTPAAMYLRRVWVVGPSFAAALTHILTVVTPPAPAA